MKSLRQYFGLGLICLSLSVNAQELNSNQPFNDQANYNDPYILQMNQTIDYELPAMEPQILSNVFRWTVEADCFTIDTHHDREISFKVLRKKASVNHIELSKGESMVAVVAPEEAFHLSVSAGATVELTNLSDKSVKTRCIAGTG